MKAGAAEAAAYRLGLSYMFIATLFTSTMPSRHQVLDVDRGIPPKLGMLTDTLASAGYTVAIASDQAAIGAKLGLPDPAMKAIAAIQHRIDDHPRASLGTVRTRGLDHFADHLVAHDQRILRRDTAGEDFQIGAANAAVGHPNDAVASVGMGLFNILQAH